MHVCQSVKCGAEAAAEHNLSAEARGRTPAPGGRAAAADRATKQITVGIMDVVVVLDSKAAAG